MQPIFSGFFIRLLAAVLDVAVLVLMAIVVTLLFATLTGNLTLASLGSPMLLMLSMFTKYPYTASLIYIVIGILYFPVAESSAKMQGTFGKYLLGANIVGMDGNKISFIRACARYYAKGISFSLIGLWFALFSLVLMMPLPVALPLTFLMAIIIMGGLNKHKRSLHDNICDTYVITA